MQGQKMRVLMVFMGLAVFASLIASYAVYGNLYLTLTTLVGMVCAIFITFQLTEKRKLGKPIPWEDVEEGAPFWVIQEMENNQFLVKFWPGDIRYIVGYPGLYGVRGWRAKSGERAVSVKDPWPSPV
jgi:hypothetical protein